MYHEMPHYSNYKHTIYMNTLLLQPIYLSPNKINVHQNSLCVEFDIRWLRTPSPYFYTPLLLYIKQGDRISIS